jgi:uncharacterized protein involved in exopolysaccharide biosynthesis
MAKKSKEIEIGGWRIQVDPLILVRRVLTRRKRMLLALALLGMIATALLYKNTAKRYTSSAEIVIRQEAFQEDYLRKLLNVVARYVGSDTEMMIIINELNLYAKTRAGYPYDIALREMKRELKIDRPGGAISISFTSKNPLEAQGVVAFVTERIMTKLADLKDSPFRQQLEGIDSSLGEVEPRFKEAELKLFEFKEQHPEIAIRQPDILTPVGSPIGGVNEDLARANRDLKRCYAPQSEPAPRPKKKATPGCQKLRTLERDRDSMLSQFTANHPSVIAAEQLIKQQQAVCDKESSASEDGDGVRAGMTPQECVAAVTARIKRLSEYKVELEKGASKKPKLQRRWSELSVEAGTLETQLTALKETHARTLKERLIAANEFKDSFVLVDPPRVPELPSYPDRNQFLAFGVAVTFIIAMFLAVLFEALRQTFADARELEEQTGIPVLASLPNIGEGG